MINGLLIKLAINLLLFLSFGYLLNRIRPFVLTPKSNLKEKVIYSVVFGFMAVIAILLSYDLNGVKLDLRIIPITLAGFYGGPVTGILAALWPSLYQFSSGVTSISLIGAFFAISLGFFVGMVRGIFSKNVKTQFLFAFMFAIYYSIAFLFTLPKDHLWTNLTSFFIDLELNYTIGILLIINQIEKFREEYLLQNQLVLQKEELELKNKELETKGKELEEANLNLQILNKELINSKGELLEAIQKLDLSSKEVSVEKNRVLAVLDSVDQEVIICDIKGEVIHLSKNAELLFGIKNYDKFNCVNLNNLQELSQIFKGIVDTQEYINTCNAIMENPAVIINSTYNLYQEHQKVISGYTSPVIDKCTGNILGRVFVYRDVTKEYEREMERNNLLNIEATLGDFAYNATLMFKEIDILTATENIIKKIVPSDFGAISLVDDAKLPLRPEHIWCFRGCNTLATGNIEVAGRCKAVLAGQLYKVADDKNNIACNCFPIATEREAYMCVPLTAMGKTFGIVHVGNHNQKEFDIQIEENLRRIASIAAMGISNLRLIEATKEQVVKDHLTGLYNKKYLDEYIDRELENEANHPISMLVLDVDKFKNINDTYGHTVGDEILIALADTVKNTVRNSDIVGRYGGEEFEVLLPKTSFDKALRVGEKIRKAVEDRVFETTAGNLKATISIGVATCPVHGQHKKDIFIASDKALYKAKEWGRNRVVGYDQVIEKDVDSLIKINDSNPTEIEKVV